jgi:hypothetical protein
LLHLVGQLLTCKVILSSAILRGVGFWLFTDVSGFPVGTIFSDQAFHKHLGLLDAWADLMFDEWTDRLSQKSVTVYQTKQRNIPEE